MKNIWQSIVRIVTIVFIFVAISFMFSHRPAGASPGASQTAEPQIQGLEDRIPTNQIIIKYKSTSDQKGRNAPASEDRMQSLSVAAGVDLEYVRAMSGNAHVLRTTMPMRLFCEAT